MLSIYGGRPYESQIAALQNGEIDMIEAPGHDLLPLLAADKNINLLNSNPTGNQYTFRFNSTAKPFDNPKIRHAVMVAFNQEDFLKATIGDPAYFKPCKAPFVCGTPLASDAAVRTAAPLPRFTGCSPTTSRGSSMLASTSLVVSRLPSFTTTSSTSQG